VIRSIGARFSFLYNIEKVEKGYSDLFFSDSAERQQRNGVTATLVISTEERPMSHVLILVSGILILATVLPLIKTSAWWIRIFDFPRAQIAVLILAVFLLSLAFGDTASWTGRGVLLALAVCFFYQGYWILPYMPWMRYQVVNSRREVAGGRFSVMIANVLMSNRNTDALLALIQRWDPDIVLTVETDDYWAAALKVLEAEYPASLTYPRDNTYGMLLYSRFPFRSASLRFLIEEGVPSMFVTVELESGDEFKLVCLHPRPPRPDIAQDSDERDAELLLAAKELGDQPGPVVVTGDLNDVAWSHTTRLFQRVSGLLDPRRGRGLFSTFHARYPLWRYPLDHIFHSEHFRLVRLERLPQYGSDHFPIYAELSYEPDAQAEQEPPEEDAEDRSEADEMIENGRK
jgi:endonuclease/exonuclease/phosphatase (EEP) superfamily protein YafD